MNFNQKAHLEGGFEMGVLVLVFSLVYAATLLSPCSLALTQDGKAPIKFLFGVNCLVTEKMVGKKYLKRLLFSSLKFYESFVFQD